MWAARGRATLRSEILVPSLYYGDTEKLSQGEAKQIKMREIMYSNGTNG